MRLNLNYYFILLMIHVFKFSENLEAVTMVKFCKDTHYFFSGGQDGHLKYWDGDTGQLIIDLEEATQMIRDIVISSAGDYVVAAGNDTGFRVWKQTN